MTAKLTEDEVRELRALAQRILEIVPDPDAVVHWRVEHGTLCGRGGPRPRTSWWVNEVTCEACRVMDANLTEVDARVRGASVAHGGRVTGFPRARVTSIDG